MNKIVIQFVIGAMFASGVAFAGDIEWNGRYRFEGISVRNTALRSGDVSKAYMLHHLTLEPKIVASDAINIYGTFGILNNSKAYHLLSQMGDFMGSGPNPSTTAGSTNAANSNVVSDTQSADSIKVQRLYLVWTQEFSTLMVGRAPVQFGLGITHNAGLGEFDHWYDSRDLVAYKILMGNMSFTPMLGKVNEGTLNQEDDVNDYAIQFQYDNPDTRLSMGVFYEVRIATKSGNDAPTAIGGTGTPAATVDGSWEGKQMNLFVSKKTDEVSFGLEAGFQNGTTGIKRTGGAEASLEGFGIASEFNYDPMASSWGLGLKAGLATGDDPNTSDKYEGFVFDRNYDVAFILFNHYVGNYDIFRTYLAGKSTDPHADADTEALSNVFYVAPALTYKWSELWSSDLRFTWATLNQSPLPNSANAGNVDKAVGTEIDLSLTWRPTKQVVWGFESGFLLPGEAFKGGGRAYPTDGAYGIQTKAAVSF